MKSFLIVLFGIGCYVVNAQNLPTDTSATFVTYWNTGDERTLSITISKTKFEKDLQKARDTVTYSVKVKVVESNDTGYVIHWTFLDFNPLALTVRTDGKSAIPGLAETVIYKTDQYGAFLELVNWPEIKASLNAGLEQLIASRPQTEQSIAAFEHIKSLYATKEKIEAITIRDIQLYHSAYGGEFVLGEQNVVETQLPNVFGGDPFPALLRSELVEIDQEDGTCTLSVTQEIDKRRATEVISQFVQRMGNGKNDMQVPVLEILDHSKFVEELETGWLKEAYHKRTMRVAEHQGVDIMHIRLHN